MYFDLLAKIRNAAKARKDVLYVPYSKMDHEVAKILLEANYLRGVQKKALGRQQCLEIKLFESDKRHVMNGFKIISKPSRHFYVGYRSIRPVKQGYGLGVLSTPKGLLSHRDAKKQKVGGEYLFEVW